MSSKSKSGKKATTTERAGSPVPEADGLDLLDPADEQPEQDPPPQAKKKKSKKSSSDVTATSEAAPPKKKKKNNDAEPVAVDDDDDEAAEEDAGEEAVEIDWEALDKWVKEFKSANRRLPKVAELVKDCGFEEAVAKKVALKLKNAADAEKNKKKSKRIRGYTALARDVGYCYLPEVDKKGESVPKQDLAPRSDAGIDMLHPLVSMADTARLATFLPCTPDAVTVTQAEFNQHMELVKTTFAQSVAREVTANVDPMFRYCVNTAAKMQIATGGTKITPATMMQVLKPMVDHLAFSSVLAPPGLVKFTKDRAPPARKNFPQGEKGLAQWKKAVKAFNKEVKYNDRGIGLLEGADDAELDSMDAEDAAANAKAFKKFDTEKVVPNFMAGALAMAAEA